MYRTFDESCQLDSTNTEGKPRVTAVKLQFKRSLKVATGRQERRTWWV